MQEMVIYGVSFDQVGKSPIVLLKTAEGNRFLPIWIGAPEATAILMKLQGAAAPRPLTHDLFTNVLGQLDAILGHDVSAGIGGIRVPTLVTVGELDAVFPRRYSEELAAAIPGARLVVFPGGSHQFATEDPSTFDRVTLGWLDAHAGDQG